MNLLSAIQYCCRHAGAKQYIRFFAHKNDGIPVNSEFICFYGDEVPVETMVMVGETTEEWFKNHPQGKIDYVWIKDGKCIDIPKQ
jgi:hypothetical protein